MTTALITGATSGIGLAFAREYARQGTDLVLVARDTQRLEATASELRTRGVDVEVLSADLADADAVARVVHRLESDDAPVDILVNNAGFGLHGGMIDADAAEMHHRAITVMIDAVFSLATAAARAMRQRGTGQIINTASAAAWIMQGQYSAIKAYVLRFSQGLGLELAGTGVTVTALCPGWVRTEFHQRAGISSSKLPDAVWIDADELAREAIADAAKGKQRSIPSLKWKVALNVAQHLPDWAITKITAAFLTSRQR